MELDAEYDEWKWNDGTWNDDGKKIKLISIPQQDKIIPADSSRYAGMIFYIKD